MTTRHDPPAGVPCWVDTFQPDPVGAAAFYGRLLGWQLDEATPAVPDPPGRSLVARLQGAAVAGIAQAPPGLTGAVWTTYVRVDDVPEAIDRATGAGGTLVAGPAPATGGGRFAVLLDADGVAFGVRDGRGAERVNEPGTWVMSALHTPSLPRAEEFYGALFGWRLEPVPGVSLAYFRLPGHTGGDPGRAMPRDVVAVASPTDAGGGVPPHWAVGFRVHDVDACVEAAVALGGAVVVAPVDTPGLRSAAVADPQGGVVALVAPFAT